MFCLCIFFSDVFEYIEVLLFFVCFIERIKMLSFFVCLCAFFLCVKCFVKKWNYSPNSLIYNTTLGCCLFCACPLWKKKHLYLSGKIWSNKLEKVYLSYSNRKTKCSKPYIQKDTKQMYRVVQNKHSIFFFIPKLCFTIFFHIFQVV